MKAIDLLVGTHLVPSNAEKSQHEDQLAWLCKVQSVKVLIENTIASVSRNADNIYGEESINIIQGIRYEVAPYFLKLYRLSKLMLLNNRHKQ